MELVIRTASSVLVGRLAPREAVTILATQTPRALQGAEHLANGDPGKARDYATLVHSLEEGLAGVSATGHDALDLALVREDLAALGRALQPE